MDEKELELLLDDIESDRIERKAADSDRDKIRQAICAFANDLPNHKKVGVIFVGVHDDGRCNPDWSVTDERLRTLADMRSDGNILPFPVLTVQKRVVKGCEVAVIIVEPSEAPPVRYNGRVWIRVGPRRATATAEEERRLSEKRRAGDLPFDLRPLSSATVDDLDVELFRREYLPFALPPDVLAENQRSIYQQLAALRFIASMSSALPTILGILVVGKSPLDFVPGAYLQFLRIDGTELTDPIKDQKDISGSLASILRRLDELLPINISTATDIAAQPIEIRRPDYPIVALQQLTRNAILHRNYDATNAPVRITWFSDRIEIQNPGGPFGQVTKENFGQPGITDYRNPHLAEAMKNLGYVQKFGLGIQLARQELQKNGNPPLELVPEDSRLLAIVRRK